MHVAYRMPIVLDDDLILVLCCYQANGTAITLYADSCSNRGKENTDN